MTLTASAMPAIVGMAAIGSGPAISTIAAGNGLAICTFLRNRKKHSSKEKEHRAGEYQQQDSEMHPSGCGHPTLAPFPRLGRHFNSTMRM